ncbi:MAG TPA: hypothetical protein VMG12_04365 [Polyangiaceae bacterium]|nr:hypothetical protein [Polyangiaceae bacterium]
MNRESIPGFGAEDEAPRRAPRALDAPCAWLAWAVPLIVGVGAASAEPGWDDDVGILRDLGFARVGFEGGPSTLLVQLAALLPIGGRFVRASLVGVLALAFASWLFFGAVRALLDRRGAAPIHPLLALFASSLWALGPAVLGEANRVGGALVALALVLVVLRLLPAAFERADARAMLATGLATGAALAECHAAGACAALVLLAAALTARQRAALDHGAELLASLAFAFVLFASLRWVWPASAPVLPGVEAGAALGGVVAAFARSVRELGAVVLVLAAAGAALAFARGVLQRRVALPWLVLGASGPLVAWLLPSPTGDAFGSLVPGLALAAFFPVALAQGVALLWASRLPLARHAAVLSVTFASTLVLSRADRVLLTRASPQGVEAWTEEAFAALPPRSVLVVQTPALVRRLLASRVLHGTRPDVVVVPSGFITAGSLGRELQRREPFAAPLLRQLWVNGTADEYSLSGVADERPVFVELDSDWDRRLLEHLRPTGLWLGFSPHAIGASERREATQRAVREARDAVALSGGADALDAGTRSVLGGALAGQALALAGLDEPAPARRLLSAARRIDRNSPLVREAQQLLADAARGRMAASGRIE